MADSKLRESLRDFLTQYPLWTAVDQFLDSKWGKRFLAFLGGAVVTGIGWIVSLFTALSSGWKYGFFGAFAALLFVALVIYLTKEKEMTIAEPEKRTPLTPIRAGVQGADMVSPVIMPDLLVPAPREEIRFDYLPDSPLSHGWKSARWAKHPMPSDAIWRADTDGSMVMELSDIYCPIVYEVGSKAALSTRLVCDLRFSTSAELFVVVRLLTRDGSRPRDGGIKFELSRRQPYYTKEYDEWVLPIDPPSLGNGWHHLDISLTDAVGHTWGQAGWMLSELLKIRLRGHLGISPIKLY